MPAHAVYAAGVIYKHGLPIKVVPCGPSPSRSTTCMYVAPMTLTSIQAARALQLPSCGHLLSEGFSPWVAVCCRSCAWQHTAAPGAPWAALGSTIPAAAVLPLTDGLCAASVTLPFISSASFFSCHVTPGNAVERWQSALPVAPQCPAVPHTCCRLPRQRRSSGHRANPIHMLYSTKT